MVLSDKEESVNLQFDTIKKAKLQSSDWAILMKYDRETGNLFRYDAKTQRLDRYSRNLLKDTQTIQRLLENKMILPGGWLSEEAKRECARIEQRLKEKRIISSENRNDSPQQNGDRQMSGAGGVRKKNVDWATVARFEQTSNEASGINSEDHFALSLRDIFHVIFKRKFLIMVFFASVVTIIGVVTFLIDPTYEANSQILVKLGRESLFIPATGDLRPIVNYNREERINSEVEILKSRTLVENVVSLLGPTEIYPDLKEDPQPLRTIKQFLSRFKEMLAIKGNELSPLEEQELKLKVATENVLEQLKVEGLKNSNVIQITFRHESPQMAVMVLNKLTDIYRDHHLQVHKTPQSHTFFQEQSELLKSKLVQSEDQLKNLKKLHNITSLEQERSLILNQASELQSDLNKTSSQIVETQKRIRQLRQQVAATPKTISQGEEINANQDLIGTLETRLVELELEEEELLTKYTEQSRLVQNIRAEIKIVRDKLSEQETKNYGKKMSGINPTYQNLQESLFRNEAELDAIKAKAQTQRTQLQAYQDKLEDLNQIETQINQLQEQIEVDRQNYRLYLSKFEESRISDAMDSQKISSVSVLEHARVPMEPVSPKKMLNLLIAVALGIFGGIGLAYFIEYLDDKLEKVEDVESFLELPVLASVPVFKSIQKMTDEQTSKEDELA